MWLIAAVASLVGQLGPYAAAKPWRNSARS